MERDGRLTNSYTTVLGVMEKQPITVNTQQITGVANSRQTEVKHAKVLINAQALAFFKFLLKFSFLLLSLFFKKKLPQNRQIT